MPSIGGKVEVANFNFAIANSIDKTSKMNRTDWHEEEGNGDLSFDLEDAEFMSL